MTYKGWYAIIPPQPPKANTLDQSESVRDANQGVVCIPPSSNIIEVSPSDSFVSYPGHSFRWGLIPQ